jgi:hypothetical protein
MACLAPLLALLHQCTFEAQTFMNFFPKQTITCYVSFIMFCFIYRENAGLLALTRVGSRRVIQISAGFMIFFSVFGMLALST